MERETKDVRVPIETKDLEEQGIFRGYCAIFNKRDLNGDIIAPGAFNRTLDSWEKKGKPIPVLFNHDENSPIGGARLWTDSKGVRFEAKLELEIPKAAEARALMRAGIINATSIGFQALQFSGRRGVDRVLQEVKLYEMSPVLWPAMEDARVSDVKSERDASQDLLWLPEVLEELQALSRDMHLHRLSREMREFYAARRLGALERR